MHDKMEVQYRLKSRKMKTFKLVNLMILTILMINSNFVQAIKFKK